MINNISELKQAVLKHYQTHQISNDIVLQYVDDSIAEFIKEYGLGRENISISGNEISMSNFTIDPTELPSKSNINQGEKTIIFSEGLIKIRTQKINMLPVSLSYFFEVLPYCNMSDQETIISKVSDDNVEIFSKTGRNLNTKFRLNEGNREVKTTLISDRVIQTCSHSVKKEIPPFIEQQYIKWANGELLDFSPDTITRYGKATLLSREVIDNLGFNFVTIEERGQTKRGQKTPEILITYGLVPKHVTSLEAEDITEFSIFEGRDNLQRAQEELRELIKR